MSANWSSAGLDTWFGDKVDTGSVTLRPSAVTPSGAHGVAVMDRPNMPTSLEFGTTEESEAATIFPEEIAMRFQSEEELKIPAAAAVPAEEVAPPDG